MLSHCLRARLAYLVETNIFLDGMNVALAGMSAVERLRSLNKIWRKMEPRLLPCRIQGADEAESAGDGIILRNVQYSRGTTTVSVEHLVIGLGIYALTGANKVARAHYFDHLNR